MSAGQKFNKVGTGSILRAHPISHSINHGSMRRLNVYSVKTFGTVSSCRVESPANFSYGQPKELTKNADK